MLEAGEKGAQRSAWSELGKGSALHPFAFPSSPGMAYIQLTRGDLEEGGSSQKEAEPWRAA